MSKLAFPFVPPSRLRARLPFQELRTHRRPRGPSPQNQKRPKPHPATPPNRFPDIRPRASVVECGMKFRSIGPAAINHPKTPERITAPVPLTTAPFARSRLRRFARDPDPPPYAPTEGQAPPPIHQKSCKSCKSCQNWLFPLAPLRAFAASRETPIPRPTHPPKANLAKIALPRRSPPPPIHPRLRPPRPGANPGQIVGCVRGGV